MNVKRLDRLSALVSRFELNVIANANSANLAIFSGSERGSLDRVVFYPHGVINQSELDERGAPVFLALTEWGGRQNPLLTALPSRIELDLSDDSDLLGLARLLVAEYSEPRCGSSTVLGRLGEVLLIRLFRKQIERGKANVGLLGGLADARLSRAIVAMHDSPGHGWSNELLADEAGLSLSRFTDHFAKTVGQPPMSYLRQWRMLLARQDIERGDRVQSVASRYGYNSSEALTRAFRKTYGLSPRQVCSV